MFAPRNLCNLLLIAAIVPRFAQAFVPVQVDPRTTSVSLAATSDRRNFVAGLAVAGASLLVNPGASFAASQKVVVLGGTGFVGSRVVSRLKSLGVEVVVTSRDGRDGTVALDVASDADVSGSIKSLAQGADAVISCIGAIGTSDDLVVNSASGSAALGAKAAGVNNFVYISVAPEVAEFAWDIDFLKPYMQGKSSSMDAIRSSYSTYTLIEPTFIFGGDEFKVNPPRVAGFYGNFIEGLLSSPPLRAITSVAPKGIIKIALEPPVSVDAVADAAVASALGKSTLKELDTYDAIKGAASKL